MAKTTSENKSGWMIRFVKAVERIGNKIPHPMYMFIILTIVALALSMIMSSMGVSVTYTGANSAGEISEQTVSVINMLSKPQLQNFIASINNNFMNSSVVVFMMVLSMFMMIADSAGFFTVGLRRLLAGTPKFLATYILSVVCICANICSTGGYVFVITLGVIVYKNMGRNPLGGIAVAWASSAAGFTANILPATTDVVIATVASPLAEQYGYKVHVLSTWYFMIAATLILAFVTTLIAEKFLTKIYPATEEHLVHQEELSITDDEKRGLRWTGISVAVLTIIMLLLTVPQNGFFRSDDGTLIPSSPLMSSLIIVICIYFLVIGVSFGFGSRNFKSGTDVAVAMSKGIGSIANVLVVFFFASQFIYIFNASNMGTIIAVKGQQFLASTTLPSFAILVLFVLVCAIINIFVPNATTKWLILAPISIPMLTGLGIHPAFTMLAYRIGDTTTNAITPLNSGLPIAIAKVEEVTDGKDIGSGIGTIISAQFPFAIAYFVTLLAMMFVFLTCHIPLGPGM